MIGQVVTLGFGFASPLIATLGFSAGASAPRPGGGDDAGFAAYIEAVAIISAQARTEDDDCLIAAMAQQF